MMVRYCRTLIALMLFMASHIYVYSDTLPEVRGVWLTTNMGLDWPAGETDTARQKASMLRILDRLKDCNFNLVIFQVEANGDALWPSSIEPAMSSVTGSGDGKLRYDIGRWIVGECHKRGMECHAWIVPYRLGSAKNAAKYAESKIRHPYYTCASYSIDYEGTRYLDPGNPRSLEFLKKLYAEFLKDCPYDGISLDYTRYPSAKFPDNGSYARYGKGFSNKDDWRRDNINRFVAMIDSLAQTIKPGIIIGSAPIGTYKNVGQWKNATAYGSYQQDPARWIADGHHDLIIPQMYWGENRGFSDHMDTWVKVADGSATLVVGLAPYKMVDGSHWTPDDVVRLVKTARAHDGVSGVCFFRAEHIAGDNQKVVTLRKKLKQLFPNPAPLPWR